jgi:hypothetical protein
MREIFTHPEPVGGESFFGLSHFIGKLNENDLSGGLASALLKKFQNRCWRRMHLK